MSPFHHRGLECRSRSQETSGVVSKCGLVVKKKGSRGKAKSFTKRTHGPQQHPLPAQDSARGYRQMTNTEIRLILVFAGKDGEAPYNQQKQDRELTVAQTIVFITKFRLKLKKVEKSARPFRYDLNQIPHDYTVEVRNRFRD